MDGSSENAVLCGPPQWEEVEEHLVIYGSRHSDLPSAQQCRLWLRHHWEIENRILDVTYGEDRNHARKIALPLSKICCLVINVIRQQGYRYIPDGQRATSARSDHSLAWLGQV